VRVAGLSVEFGARSGPCVPKVSIALHHGSLGVSRLIAVSYLR